MSDGFDSDVVIVGGGMVGLLLALSLVQNSSLRVLVLEEQAMLTSDHGSEISFDGRSTALSRTTAHWFQVLNIWSDMQLYSAAIGEIVVSERGHWGRFRLNAEVEGVDALGYVIENAQMGQLLMQASKKYPHLCIQSDCSVQELVLRGDTTELRISGQEPRFTSLLVAADGAHSRLRREMGMVSDHVRYDQCALVCNVRMSHPVAGRALERFAPGEIMALLPRADGSQALIWTTTPQRAKMLQRLRADGFLRELECCLGRGQGRALERTEPVLYPLEKIMVDQPVQPGRLVLGNAAHFLHPVAGQGFNLCVRDIQVLTRLVLDQWRNGRPLGALSVLQHYQEQRIRDQQIIAGFSDAVARMGSASWFGVDYLRSLVLLGMDQWPVGKRLLAQISMGAA